MDLSDILNQLGEDREQYLYAVAPPVFQSSNFYFKDVESLRKAFNHQHKIPLYTRGSNPTVNILRKKIAALAGSEDALAFGSGIAATCAAVLGNIQAGEHAVCVKKPYGWTNTLFTKFLPRYGVQTTMVDGTDINNFINVLQPNTKIIYIESPNTFTYELQDIEAVVKLAKEKNLITIIDNSYSTSLGQRCIEMGVDIEVHSATKYYGGHSDVVAGYLMGSKKMVQHIFETQLMNFGGITSPHDAWLLLRSLRTLPIRLKQINQTAMQITEWLEQQAKVEKVIYPFLKSFPQYELAKKQMKFANGLFTILLKAENVSQVELFCNSLKRFLIAVSWGSYESLIMPACSFPVDPNTQQPAYPFNMIRFYVGLEDVEDLKEDLVQAFQKIN